MDAPEQYVVQILWDVIELKEGGGRKTEFWSPPIGPFSRNEAEQRATEYRKRLRKIGKPATMRVKVSRLASHGEVTFWFDDREAGETDQRRRNSR